MYTHILKTDGELFVGGLSVAALDSAVTALDSTVATLHTNVTATFATLDEAIATNAAITTAVTQDVAALDASTVSLTGDQEISGAKTFTSVVRAPDVVATVEGVNVTERLANLSQSVSRLHASTTNLQTTPTTFASFRGAGGVSTRMEGYMACTEAQGTTIGYTSDDCTFSPTLKVTPESQGYLAAGSNVSLAAVFRYTSTTTFLPKFWNVGGVALTMEAHGTSGSTPKQMRLLYTTSSNVATACQMVATLIGGEYYAIEVAVTVLGQSGFGGKRNALVSVWVNGVSTSCGLELPVLIADTTTIPVSVTALTTIRMTSLVAYRIELATA